MDLIDERSVFWRDGFIVLRSVFDREEMDYVKRAICESPHMRLLMATITEKKAFHTISVWNDVTGSDIFSKATRSCRLVDRLANFFVDDIYVYHNKVTLKLPGVTGFPYHQDYAYWYSMGNLFPDMAASYIALEPATEANGCLKMVKGSHRLGRIDHEGHDGVEPERLAVILSRLEEEVIEMDVGDVVLFHSTTLHGSDNNTSETSRLSLLGCYNTKHNDSYMKACGHPFYTQQERVTEKITAADLPKF